MVGYRDLWAARPQLWSAAAEDWKRLGGQLDDAALELRIAVLVTVAEWWRDSAAADAAVEKINTAVTDLQQLAIEISAVSGALSALASAISHDQQLLKQADEYAMVLGLRVNPDGSIVPANVPATHWSDGKQEAGTAALRALIDQALADATAADTAANTALRALALVPAGTPVNAGRFYVNDTKIETPPELAEDNRPQGSVSWFNYFRQRDDEDTFNELYAIQYGLRDVEGDTLAAKLLGHWLAGTGTAIQIDPRAMMGDIVRFRRDVQAQIDTALAGGGSNFDSGWLTGAVEDDIDKDHDTGPKAQDWFYALNHYQYRVRGTVTVVDGHKTANVTVELFKRYNFGNPAGGAPRADLSFHGLGDLPQNQIAQLNADGLAKDFNVWGSTTYQVTQ